MKDCPGCGAPVFWHMMFNTYGDRWVAHWLHENKTPECDLEKATTDREGKAVPSD
jgi:hypothetical protein